MVPPEAALAHGRGFARRGLAPGSPYNDPAEVRRARDRPRDHRADGVEPSAMCCRWRRARTKPPSPAGPRPGRPGMRRSCPACGTCGTRTTGAYGARKLRKRVRRAGIDIGRDQVAGLMRAAGIGGARRTKRVRTTRADPVAARHRGLDNRTSRGWPGCRWSDVRRDPARRRWSTRAAAREGRPHTRVVPASTKTLPEASFAARSNAAATSSRAKVAATISRVGMPSSVAMRNAVSTSRSV